MGVLGGKGRGCNGGGGWMVVRGVGGGKGGGSVGSTTGGDVCTDASRKGTKLKPCATYSGAELPKKGKRRVVSPAPSASVVSTIIATRHTALCAHALTAVARAA